MSDGLKKELAEIQIRFIKDLCAAADKAGYSRDDIVCGAIEGLVSVISKYSIEVDDVQFDSVGDRPVVQ